MIFKKIDLNEFESHKIYYYDQIPKAQNSNPEYKQYVFDYYQKALKDSNENFVAMAWEDGDIIGVALFRFYEQEQRYFVLNVNTKKEFQNSPKKVATNVLKFGLKEFFKKHDRIFLWVGKENLVAQQLYRKLGFETTDYFPENLEFLQGEKGKQIIMELGKAKFESALNADSVIFMF